MEMRLFIKEMGIVIRRIVPFFLLCSLFGCSGLWEQPVYPTSTPSASPTVTETIIWFPATSTATTVPTRQPEPTENLHPAVGDILFQDDFSQKSMWSTQSGSGGKIAFGKEELTLAVQEPKFYLASLYTLPVIKDASVEITSNVTLCKGEDFYGLLVRATNGLNGYRFMVNCMGKVKLEILKMGKPSTLVDWLQSGQVLPGSPYQVRLRVWMVENELRFFLNDVFQFSTRDAIYSDGKIGVFARQAADTPITVNFSNLVIRSIEPGYKLPKATPKPTATRQGRYIPVNTAAPAHAQ